MNLLKENKCREPRMEIIEDTTKIETIKPIGKIENPGTAHCRLCAP